MRTTREVLVIGGNRYFGKRLIERLLAAGDRVTVLNRGSSAPPPGAVHLVADRDDEQALSRAIGTRVFDVVLDQVCYTPRQAEIACRVLAGRTARYVMTSTVEVYEHEDSEVPVPESAVDPATVAVDRQLPWGETEFLESHYGEGKRQAEAVFTAAGPQLPFVSVRVAHVLGGDDDFTGRLGHYADRIRTGAPIAVPPVTHPATYIHVEEIADFLFWAAGEDFTGPVNAASHGLLTLEELCAAVAARLPEGRTVFETSEGGTAFETTEGGTAFETTEGGTAWETAGPAGAEVSPFAFRRRYGMDNSRATRLGFTFGDVRQWLPRAVAETLGKDR